MAPSQYGRVRSIVSFRHSERGTSSSGTCAYLLSLPGQYSESNSQGGGGVSKDLLQSWTCVARTPSRYYLSRGLSCDHDDAIAATTSSSSSVKTLSQHLVVAVFQDRLLLVETLQGAVHALVQPPGLVHRQVVLAGDVHDQLQRLLGPL
jgi:hypothetical protein